MAKEMMIIFVYDLEYCKSEEDDPASAILYFYPNWVSDQQRTNLCGQIMGTTHFLKSVFCCPKILALQSGKFCIKEFGRFVLAVGTDRNIDDWVLQHRADTLTSFIHFFHFDLESISLQSQNNINFSEKLYSMFETYLRILQYSGNIFSNVPVLQLPKSANSVFLEAIQIMQYCQEMTHVLGGTMLYHNKVVATQLSSNLTKQLVMTDPYRIKSPAEVVSTSYCLPLGVQLLQVYISKPEFTKLSSSVNYLRNMNSMSKNQKKILSMKSVPKEPVLSAMKRDQSLIFTTVPEEDFDHGSPSTVTSCEMRSIKHIDRPKSLNLKLTTDIKPTNKLNEKNTVCTPFTGQTSVCSTPMTDKFLHDNILSICCNLDQELEENQNIEQIKSEISDRKLIDNISLNESHKIETRSESINSVLSALNSNCNIDSLKQFKSGYKENSSDVFKFPLSNMFLPVQLSDKKHSISMLDVKDKSKQYNRIMMRYFGIGLSKLNPDIINNDDDDDDDDNHLFNTITDPTYPVFRADGLIVSKPLYDTFLEKQCEFLCSELGEALDTKENQHINKANSLTNTEDWKSIDDFDCDIRDPPLEYADAPDVAKTPEINPEKYKRSLSLPLKSLSIEQNNEISFSTFNRRSLGGIQLTPLMSKLSLLAMEERSSGFCSRDTTPSEFRDFNTVPADKVNTFLNKNPAQKDKYWPDANQLGEEELQKVVMFICGQQDMVLILMLEEEGANNQELINKIWEVCIDCLGRLEVQLRHCLDPQPVTSTDQGETYSFLCVDPEWDTTQRGGPWGVSELGALTHLHRDFCQTSNLTEITLRNEDSIIYGYRCGGSEVFFQQAATSNAGLPPPADPMGVVPMKARRKLERDHAVILL